MSAPVMKMGADTPLENVARVLSEFRISGLAVTDEWGTVRGVISEEDILSKERRSEEDPHRLFRALVPSIRRRLAKVAASTAGEAMRSPPVTVPADATATDAAEFMLEQGVGCALMDDGGIVGILTRADLVRAFARADEEIAESIRAIVEGSWIAPHALAVDVSNGKVTIAGEIDSKENAALLERKVREIPGVVSVSSRLAWRSADSDFNELPL